MKKGLAISLSLIALMMTGCWDRVEIDKNAFVSTIGIDVGKDIKNKKLLQEAKPDEPFGERDVEKLRVTFAFPDISKYSVQSPQIPSDKFVKADAYSMEDALSNAVAKSSRELNLGHSRLLILSQELLQYPETVKEVMDYLSRSPRINRTMYVLAAEGDVEEFFNFNVEMENTLGAYVSGLMESSKRNASILPISLNEFLILLSQNGNAIIPAIKIDKEKQEMLIDGIAIIKNYKMVGLLSAEETSVIEMLRGKLVSGKKVIYKKGIPIDLEIDGLKRKIKFSEEKGKLVFNIDIDMEGKIKEYSVDKEVFNLDNINELQKYFGLSLSEEGERIASLVQKKYGVDVFGVREYVEKFMPYTWDKVKKNWEENFRDAVINVNVNMEIRRIGVKK